ncbi:hypothetical protein [Advenella sp. FME57]|nr:hypothetical protein [Advenella sp. FME57]
MTSQPSPPVSAQLLKRSAASDGRRNDQSPPAPAGVADTHVDHDHQTPGAPLLAHWQPVRSGSHTLVDQIVDRFVVCIEQNVFR